MCGLGRPKETYNISAPQERPNGGDTETGRTISFSDALIAIAITLLALDLTVPQVPESSAAAELPSALLGLWPNLFSSVLSFWIIGSYWLAHRRISEVVSAYDRRMQLINLLFLMWIVLGVIDALREAVLEAYDRYIGLELSEVAVDGCITKAPCGGVKAGRSPVDRGKQGIKRSTAVDGEGISP